MAEQGVDVVLTGPLGPNLEAIDDLGQLQVIPKGYDGWVLTNRVEIIGPELRSR